MFYRKKCFCPLILHTALKLMKYSNLYHTVVRVGESGHVNCVCVWACVGVSVTL